MVAKEKRTKVKIITGVYIDKVIRKPGDIVEVGDRLAQELKWSRKAILVVETDEPPKKAQPSQPAEAVEGKKKSAEVKS